MLYKMSREELNKLYPTVGEKYKCLSQKTIKKRMQVNQML